MPAWARVDHQSLRPVSIMSFRLVPSAAARTDGPSRHSTGTASPQQPQRKAAFGNWLGWLSSVPHRHRKTPELPPLSTLPPDLLQEVVKRTADAGPPPARARQLAVLRPVSKAFRDAADRVQQEEPAVQRAAAEQRLTWAIAEAKREYRELGQRNGRPLAERNRFSAESERIRARLAAVVHGLDRVVVDLDLLDKTGGFAEVALTFQTALSEHRGDPILEIATSDNARLNLMTQLLGARPQWLRSLAIGMIRDPQAELSKVLAKQTNLAVLALTGKGQLLDLGLAGLGPAIASLPGLKSLTLSRYVVDQGQYSESLGGTALASVLRELPGLEDLNLPENTWSPAAFAQVAPSLADLSGLRSLDLSRNHLGSRSDGNGAYVEHLAPALPALANLQSLNLADTRLGPADFSHLADGLASLKQLQTLNLSINQLGPEGFSRLAHLLPDLAHLRTLDLALNRLGPEECRHLTVSLVDAPALQHLHLSVPQRQPSAPTGWNPVDVDTLANVLRPLAGRQGLHIHLLELDKASLPRLQRALPALRIHDYF